MLPAWEMQSVSIAVPKRNEAVPSDALIAPRHGEKWW